MCVNRLWAAFAVPMVFDRVRDASGVFIAAYCAIAALVFGVVLGVTVHGSCRLIFCGFQLCAGWLFAIGQLEVVRDAVLDCVLCVLLICSISGTLRGVALGFTLKTVAPSV